MRAAVSTRYGPPEVVQVVDDAPEPEVAPDDLLVRVHVTTVNRTDSAYRRAYPFVIRSVSGWRGPKVAVWGTEYAGVVERVGAQVTRFAPGDRVFGYAEPRFGAHAELVAVAESSFVAPVPDGVDLRHAAAATEGGHYALSSIRRAGVQPGDRVLVHGATGAIGSAAVQLLVDLGAHVIATAPTAHVELVRGLGAAPRRRLRGRGLHPHRRDRRRRARPGRQEHLRGVPPAAHPGRRLRVERPRAVRAEPRAAPGHPHWGGAAGSSSRSRRPHPRCSSTSVPAWRAEPSGRCSTPRPTRSQDIVQAYRYVETGQKLGNVVITVTDPTDPDPESVRGVPGQPPEHPLAGRTRAVGQVRVRRMTMRGILLATASVVPTTEKPAFSNIERVPTNAIVVSIRPCGSTGCASTAGAPLAAA